MNLASEAPYDNRPVIGNIVKARSKKHVSSASMISRHI